MQIFENIRNNVLWSLGRDLNPRPLPYQGNAQPTRPPRLKTIDDGWFLQFDMPLPVFMFSASKITKIDSRAYSRNFPLNDLPGFPRNV